MAVVMDVTTSILQHSRKGEREREQGRKRALFVSEVKERERGITINENIDSVPFCFLFALV